MMHAKHEPLNQDEIMLLEVANDELFQPWITSPTHFSTCPRGLEYLMEIDQVLIQQEVGAIEVLRNIGKQNRYVLSNSLGQHCYYAWEESDLLARIFCGPLRGFIMHITDVKGKEVARMNRPFKCCSGCCWCANTDHCAFTIDVESPVGTNIGQIRQQQSFSRPQFEIMDEYGRSVFYVRGPCCVPNGAWFPCDFNFEIQTINNGETVGRICMHYTEFVKECFKKTISFTVSFPMDLDVKVKAVLLGAGFLIGYMFYERPTKNQIN